MLIKYETMAGVACSENSFWGVDAHHLPLENFSNYPSTYAPNQIIRITFDVNHTHTHTHEQLLVSPPPSDATNWYTMIIIGSGGAGGWPA